MRNREEKHKLNSPLRLFLIIVISIYMVETVIMAFLPNMAAISIRAHTLIDSTLLILFIVPVVYFFSYRPMALHIATRKKAEQALQTTLEDLEGRILARTADLVKVNLDLQNEIAERKRAEQALVCSESRLASILENAAEAIIVIAGDQTILLYNKAAEKIFGYPSGEVLGKPVDHLLAQKSVEIHRHEILNLDPRSLSGLPMETRKEIIGRRKNGSEFPAQVGFSSHLEDSQIIYTTIFSDITERKRAEQAVIASEARYRNLFHRIPVALYRTTPQGEILDGNPALVDLLGYPDYITMKQRNVADVFINPEDRLQENIILEREGIVRGYKYQVQRSDGGRIWVRDTSHLIRDANGAQLYYEGSLEDITDQVQAEEQITAHAARMKILAEISQVIADVGLASEAIAEVVTKSVSEWIGSACRITLFADKGMQPEMAFLVPHCEVFPLRSQGWFIGVMELVREPAQLPYPPEDQSVLLDIADRAALAIVNAQLYREAQSNFHKVQALHQIEIAMTESTGLQNILDTLVDQATLQLGVDAANVLILSPRSLTLDHAASKGFRTNALRNTHLRLGEGYAGQAALDKRIIKILNLRNRKTDLLRSPAFLMEEFISYYAVPLMVNGQVKGVLEIFQRSLLEPNEDWLEFLEGLARQAAIAIDNAQLFAELQRSNQELYMAYDATIEGWSHALDLRDNETEGHTQRVTEMALQLARGMGVADGELVQIRRGALLHDIGKMGIPDRILLKPGPLTDQEWDIMRKHPVYAYQLLAPITYLQPALDIPYCHHEKWDGSGYPRGLEGDQIPLVARIFAIVDVWDALSSDRPYRPAWSKEEVRRYILEQTGKHFDPCVVDAFMELIDSW